MWTAEEITEAMNVILQQNKEKGINQNRKIGRFQGYDKNGNACILIDDSFLDEAIKILDMK